MRHEFPVAVKRAALARSAGQCEAVGIRYGYAHGERCQRSVAKGSVNYEHYPRGAHDPSPETTTLANCTAICPACNTYANNKHDTPTEAKIKRIRRKHGLDPDTRKHKPKPIRSAPFRTGGKTQWPKRSFRRETNGS